MNSARLVQTSIKKYDVEGNPFHKEEIKDSRINLRVNGQKDK